MLDRDRLDKALLEILMNRKIISSAHIPTINTKKVAHNGHTLYVVGRYILLQENLLFELAKEIGYIDDTFSRVTGDNKLPREFSLKNSKLASLGTLIVDYIPETQTLLLAKPRHDVLEKESTGKKLNRAAIASVIGNGYRTEYVSVMPFYLNKRILEILREHDVVASSTEGNEQTGILPSDTVSLIIADAILEDATDIKIEAVWNAKLNQYVTQVVFKLNPGARRWEKRIFSTKEGGDIARAILTKASKPSQDAAQVEGITFNSDLGVRGYDFRISMSRFFIRMSTLDTESSIMEPNAEAYEITLRIQSLAKTIVPIGKLNLGERAVDSLKGITKVRNGAVFVTGKTGSGKNTTSAGLLNDILSEDIITGLEFGDPIEYKLPIVQIPTPTYEDMKARMKTAKVKKPDLIVVTEFRDKDMGHLIKDAIISDIFVLTTMHIARVWDMFEKMREYFGESDYKTVLSYTRGVCHQVMFREICPVCRVEMPFDTMSPREQIVYNNLQLNGHPVYRADKVKSSQGLCGCKGGYTTLRLPAAEVLFFDPLCDASVELKSTLLATTNIRKMEKELKEWMHSNRALMEYTLRDRILEDSLDFQEVVIAGATERVRLDCEESVNC